MAESYSADEGPLGDGTSVPAGARAMDRLASFRVVYAAIFAFVLLSVVSIGAVDYLLTEHFHVRVNQALRVSPADGSVESQIQRKVRRAIRGSAWVRLGGVEVDVIVIAADGTILYSGGRPVPPPPVDDPIAIFREAQRLLPASAETFTNVPVTSLTTVGILVGYGAVLITGLFFHQRRVYRREEELIESAVRSRDVTAQRASAIEVELERVRSQLLEVVPAERAHAEEIRDLQGERRTLKLKLAELAEREEKLRASAAQSMDLEEERRALEELFDEAVEDVSGKEQEIQNLRSKLRRAEKSATPARRQRGSEQTARRLRTLYKNLEMDDRAINDMVALRDEVMKLKAEEAIKRLADESDNATVRRKVGGLPPQLSIFELGFAGKGRIYYTRGKQQRFRILAIGAKNSQKTDLDYLRGLSSA